MRCSIRVDFPFTVYGFRRPESDDAIQQWVLDSELDLAITDRWADDAEARFFKPLLSDRFQPVASRQHALARSRHASWKQLDTSSTRDLPLRTASRCTGSPAPRH